MQFSDFRCSFNDCITNNQYCFLVKINRQIHSSSFLPFPPENIAFGAAAKLAILLGLGLSNFRFRYLFKWYILEMSR